MSIEALRKNREFRLVYRRGESLSNRLLVLYIFKNRKNRNEKNSPYNKVGISVSKKVGKSVVRSRVKRLILESYRLNCETLKEGHDFIFIARNPIAGKSYKEVENAAVHLLKKAGLYQNEKVIDSNSKVL
ncbi:ribonuclease P protein component [uncultured Clostridium sp.]|jgi:ribonuclease P protein component|uniref:ribonuclease P protein component n=1 Tax=uncultured Clostridium sp. TaxID=59620 RepID=UPI00261B95DD|nr:ribonuclease P protein component [uncultured Clostridium sp.]